MTSVQQSFVEVMRAVTAVGKDGKNQQQNYNFRGIDGVVNAVGPALREHGVVILPSVEVYDYQTVEVGVNRNKMASVRVTVAYQIVGPEGDAMVCRSVGEAFDSGDKATAKAMSVAFRTMLLQTLAIPTQEKDPDESSYERSAVEPELPARKAPAKPVDELPADVLLIAHEAVISALSNETLQSIWKQHEGHLDQPYESEGHTTSLRAVILEAKAVLDEVAE